MKMAGDVTELASDGNCNTVTAAVGWHWKSYIANKGYTGNPEAMM